MAARTKPKPKPKRRPTPKPPAPPPEGSEYLELHEVAWVLRVCVETVRREIRAGRLTPSRIASGIKVHRDDLAAYKRAIREPARPEEPPKAATPRRLDLIASGLWDGEDD